MPKKDISDEVKKKRIAEQLQANTQAFWEDTLLHGNMPEDPNSPIQDYIYPDNYLYPGSSEGTLDVMPNQFDQVPGWEPNQRGFTPSYLSPRIQGTRDAPNITFPERLRIRA